MVMSPRLSFKGYDFRVALYRNIKSVKAIVAIVSGANFFAGFEWGTFFLSLSAGVLALGVKLVEDAVDYFFKEVEVTP